MAAPQRRPGRFNSLWPEMPGLKGVVWQVFLISGVVNILGLTGSIFMLQVYDRVLLSRSVPTLVALAVMAGGMYLTQGVLDWLRGRVMVRVAAKIDEKLVGPAQRLMVYLPVRVGVIGDGLGPQRDLDTVRSFIGSSGPTSLADLFWIPIYLVFVFWLHPVLGWTTLGGAMLLVVLTLITEVKTREPTRAAAEAAGERQQMAEASRRNAETLAAMGFGDRVLDAWRARHDKYVDATQKATDAGSGIATISKTFRLALQSVLLGLGAYFVLLGEMTAGGIIACSIASARALAPIEQSIGNWKGFVAFRQAWARLRQMLLAAPAPPPAMHLPKPVAALDVEGLAIAPPGVDKLVVTQASMTLKAGDAIGLIGPSGSGKSSLVRAIVGAWPVQRGTVRLDGAAMDQYGSSAGRHIGYLPQEVNLFDGSVAANISRFDPEANEEAILAAARAAGVDDLVRHLPDGYNTMIGEAGAKLSAGQRQRIALARALYGDPFLVVLDEPNANLDGAGDEALNQAISSVRARGGIVVIVAHRPSAIANVNLLGLMAGGQLQRVGPRDEILKAMAGAQTSVVPMPTAPVAPRPDRVAVAGGGRGA